MDSRRSQKSNSSGSKGIANIKMEVDGHMLRSLLAMQINENLARWALVSVGNTSVDSALHWIAELGAEEMEALCQRDISKSTVGDSEWEDINDEVYFKMVYVINKQLKMGAGKIASQVGHATVGLYRRLQSNFPKFNESLSIWEADGERKMTLKCNNTDEMREIHRLASYNDLGVYTVYDGGLTRVLSGEAMVVAIFGDEDTVDEVTGHLKLL